MSVYKSGVRGTSGGGAFLIEASPIGLHTAVHDMWLLLHRNRLVAISMACASSSREGRSKPFTGGEGNAPDHDIRLLGEHFSGGLSFRNSARRDQRSAGRKRGCLRTSGPGVDRGDVDRQARTRRIHQDQMLPGDNHGAEVLSVRGLGLGSVGLETPFRSISGDREAGRLAVPSEQQLCGAASAPRLP